MEGQNDLTTKDYSKVNIDAIEEAITSLDNFKTDFLGEYNDDMASKNDNFTKISEINIDKDKKLAIGFDVSISDVIEHFDMLTNSLTEYVNEIKANNKKIGEEFPDPPNQYQYNGGGGGGSTEIEGFYDSTHEEFFKGLSLNDLSYILSILNTLADENNMTLEQLLQNVECGEYFKQIILSQPDISDDIKTFFENSPTDSLLQDLRTVLFNPTTTSEIFDFESDTSTFFEDFATTTLTNMDGSKTTQVSMKDLLSDTKVLKEKLYRLNYYMTNTFSGIGEYDIQKVLLNLYETGEATSGLTNINEALDGVEDKDLFVNYIKAEIDSMAQKNGVTYKEILSDERYAPDLMSIPENLSKVLLYGEVTARTDNPSSMWPVGATGTQQ